MYFLYFHRRVKTWTDAHYQTKHYAICICCFSAKHTALRRKSKDWLAWNQDCVSEWGDMSIRWLLLQWVSTMKIQLSMVYFKADLIIISLIWCTTLIIKQACIALNSWVIWSCKASTFVFVINKKFVPCNWTGWSAITKYRGVLMCVSC
jgi:hypothetical protein